MAEPSSPGAQAPGTPQDAESDVLVVHPPSSGRSEAEHSQPFTLSEEAKAELDKILLSDIGVTTLLTRLKQSIASAKDFASFLKKRSTLEEDHAQGLKKLARAAHESATRIENRQGSYSSNYDEVNRIHDRMSDHGLKFAASIHQMFEDLQELAGNMERGRKHWKTTALSAEKRVTDAESQAEKAKAKYDSLADQYDRAKTGDRQGGKFGLKGPKSAAQHEEELHRKLQIADNDYASKVQAAQAARQELVATLRPQAVRAMQDLVAECDSGLALQLQKFATFNEKLLLGTGLCVSPLKGTPNAPEFRSLREVAHAINNERDFNDYVLSFSGKQGAGTPSVIEYERHPTLATSSSQPPTMTKRHSMLMPSTQSFNQPPPQNFNSQPPPPQTASSGGQIPPLAFQHNQESPQQPFQPPPAGTMPPPQHQFPPVQPLASRSHDRLPQVGGNGFGADLPPINPVFGISLEDLFRRDGTAVPMVVYQCLQAIELFGLDVEGIFRLSGSTNHIKHLKALFDNDSSRVDFTNPEAFFHDVNSVAGLLKQFFKDLPDPLFTAEHYPAFINAARIDDDVQRRDSLHAIINSLPDPNYATLRALTLHLNHVQERSSVNRMNAGNIAICFGPTLMGSNIGPNIADAGWQARVIETILQNTFQIFDDD